MRSLLLAGVPTPTTGRLTLFAPWDGRRLDEVAQAGPAQMEAAAAAAARAFVTTRAMPAHRRAEILRRVAVLLVERGDELAALIRDEGGKPIALAKGEVARAVDTFTLAADEATRIDGEVFGLDGTAGGVGRTAIVRRMPRGPVLAIAPFNFPLNLVAHKVAPAIAAGCPVIVKPAEQTPSAAIVLGELCVQAGWPAEAMSVLPCDRSVAGTLVDDPRLPVVSFTGSDVVGWQLRARVPRKQVLLELGGNAAAILDADADLDAALPRIALGGYAHAGQTCISVQQVLVHQDRLREARERLIVEAAQVPRGDPGDPATVCGPMIDQRQLDRITAWVGEAVGRGARAYGGGRDGNLIAPTLLEVVPEDSPLARDEAFGPVMVLRPFATLDDAFDIVNRSRFGLQCGIFTRDVRALWRAFDRLEVGGVIHDDYPTFRVDGMPYGGVKDSGVGREGPRWAIRDFTEERLLVVRA
ncbi:MAG: aldehyde dehydrogenase family protein [Myxococcales bacterium]|nr:aldehyde dehydrogenase family protein [Myxococcales bacterium]